MATAFLTAPAFAAASAALAVVVALPEGNREDVLGIVVISVVTLIAAVNPAGRFRRGMARESNVRRRQ